MPRTVGATRSADHGVNAVNYCSNGRYAVQQAMTYIAQALNGCVTERTRVLASQVWRTSAYTTRIFRGRFHVGVNVSDVTMRIICISSSSTSTAVTPSIACVVGGTSTTLYPGPRASIYAAGLTGIFQLSARFDVTPLTGYDWSVTPAADAQVMGVVIQETFASNILTETSADTSVLTDPSYFKTGAEITDASINDVMTQMTNLWKRQASIYFSDSYSETTNVGIQVTSATDVNLFDFTKTAYSTSDPGYIILNGNHARFGTNNVSAHMWAYLQGSAASGATLKFVGQGGTYGTLTYNGTPGMFTGTATMNDSYGQDTINLMANRGASGTLEVIAAGMYAYET